MEQLTRRWWRWPDLAELDSGRQDQRRRARAALWLSVALLVAALVDLVASIAVHGFSAATVLLILALPALAAAAVVARRGFATAAGVLLAVIMFSVPLASVAVIGELSTWPVAGPAIGIVLAFVLPLRWWPGVALAVVILMIGLALTADDAAEPAATGLDWVRDLAFTSVLVVVVAVYGAVSLARAEHKAELAAVEAKESAQLAGLDTLTGLPNRRVEVEDLPEAVATAAGTGEPFAVAMIDLDGFKEVNTRYGHDAGDRVLVEVAQVLTAGSRHSDTLVRHGGDEFVLAMPSTTCAEAVAVCERLRRTVAGHHWRAAVPDDRGLTLSIGISSTDRAADWPTLLHRADAQMLRAKSEGKDRVLGDDCPAAPSPT